MKKEIHFFSNYETDAIKEYLERKAAKGWKIYKKEGGCYYFKKCEPCKLHFWVFLSNENVVDKYSRYIQLEQNKNNKPKSKEKADSCDLFYDVYEDLHDKRWKYICKDSNLNICYSEYESPYPRFTDSNETVNLLKKETIYRCISIINILLYIVVFGIFCYPIGNILGKFSTLIASAFIISYFVWSLGKLIEILYWNYKEKEKTSFYEEKPNLISARRIRLSLIYFLFSFTIFIGIVDLIANHSVSDFVLLIIDICFLSFCIYIKKHNSFSGINTIIFDFIRFITILIILFIISGIVKNFSTTELTRDYVDENGDTNAINNYYIPVTLDDLGVETNDTYGTLLEHSQTIFLDKYELSNTSSFESNDEYLYIDIYKSKYKNMQNLIKESELISKEPSIKSNYDNWDSSLNNIYESTKFIQDLSDEYYYILSYDDKLVTISVTKELSYEKINMIAEIIDNEY